MFNALQDAEKKAVADKGKPEEKDSLLAVTDAAVAYEKKARELAVAMDKMNKMRAQEDATRAEEAKEMETKRREEYDVRYKQMEEKKTKYETIKARKDELTAELAGIDAKIAAATEEEKEYLEYDKAIWQTEFDGLEDPDALKTAYEDQKKTFDNAEKAAKA